MEFYVSPYQLTFVLDGLQHGLQQMAGRAFRISPRNAKANHDIFNQCVQRTQELENMIVVKIDCDKKLLKRTALLFKALEITHQRLILLSCGVEAGFGEEKISVSSIEQLLGQASRHFRLLGETLSERAGMPINLTLPVWIETEVRSLPTLKKKEEILRKEILQILEKVLEYYEHDRTLTDKVLLIRRDILDSNRVLKHTA